MSYSKMLLVQKGPLGTVWVAAVCGLSALSREQVVSTDIVASVDRILTKVDKTKYRELGPLLLGIVRLYSKQVEYLLIDCNQFLGSFQPRCSAEPSTSTRRSVHGVLKQVKRAVRAEKSGQQASSEIQQSFRSVRTTEISGPISSEGISLSLRTETQVIVQTSVVVRKARVLADQPIFTIPKRFELDSFDLGIDEDMDDGEYLHQSARQDILLEDEHQRAAYSYESYQRATCSYAVDSGCLLPEYISLPPEVIGAISEVTNSQGNGGPERGDQNADSAWFTPVKDVLPPEMMDIMAEENEPPNRSETCDTSIRELNMDGNGASVCSIPLPESQEGHGSESVLENTKCASSSANCPTVEESENGPLLEKSNTGPPVEGFPEHETEEHVSLEHPVLSCRTQAINEPLPEGIPGPPSSPKFTVKTPAQTEKRQVTRKRRRGLYTNDYLPTEREEKRQVFRRLVLDDEDLVLSNKMMGEALKDASDLVRQRGKVPFTVHDIWKVAKIHSLPHSFLDPLIPYQISTNFAWLTTSGAPERSCEESVKARRRLSYESSESYRSCNDAGNTERESIIIDELREKKLDEVADFEAPVACYTESEHVQDDVCESNDDAAKEMSTQVEGDEPSPVLSSKKGLHQSESHTPLHNEALNAALDDIDEDNPIDEEHTRDEGLLTSTRTRAIAKCLHHLFLDQNNKQGTKSLSLHQTLQGKTRKTSARFFYETLVLKNRGLIEVSQEQSFEDIILSATPGLEAELGKQSSGN